MRSIVLLSHLVDSIFVIKKKKNRIILWVKSIKFLKKCTKKDKPKKMLYGPQFLKPLDT